MPSLLEHFPDCAPNRKVKFIRAVDSFLRQDFRGTSELVIISDGCRDTIDIVNRNYRKELKEEKIILLSENRHELFTGTIRQRGIDVARGEVICNLDSDDYLMPQHLSSVARGFCDDVPDWVFWNHRTVPDNLKGVDYYYDCQPELGKICNANIAWRRSLDVKWEGCNGRRDNQAFIIQLIEKYPKRRKIYGCGYVVCHVLISKTNESTETTH